MVIFKKGCKKGCQSTINSNIRRKCALTPFYGLFWENLEQMDIEHIRHCINTGLPTGNDRFRREIEKALSIRLGQGKRGMPGKINE